MYWNASSSIKVLLPPQIVNSAPTMAPQPRQCHLVLLILVAVMAIPAGATDDVDVTGGYALPNCEPDPRWLSTANGTAFSASLAPLLAALPSAAAPTGFASLRSGNGRAFARGFCFGESPPPHLCHECLSISVDRMGVCDGSRRTGFWNAACHIAYADTNFSSASEDEYVSISSSFKHDGDVVKYYPEFYDVYQLVNLAQSLALRAANGSCPGSGGRMLATGTAMAQAKSTVRILAQCPGYATAADCYRCLEKAARVLPESLWVWGYEG